MIEALQNLLTLQGLEFGDSKGQAVEKEAAQLRGQIPSPVLAHYDRLRARGKKGLVPVRNQVCSGCHMSVPIGIVTVLMRSEEVQLCENCGRYLYLPETATPPPEPAAAAPAPPAKPRKRKSMAHAA
ncbi:hypothetical protein SBV1_2320023 [Verrucomicrobia bacterium]|nr:hypothetical protein SBV1_2320023 [Verrucomicrobiota bacterium]